MPNWSDDEGRCHYSVNGVPCYQSVTGCPMHQFAEPKPKRQPKPKVRLSAYERCLNALNMTEADQRVEVDGEVLEALLKHYDELREALRDVAERQREACAEYLRHWTYDEHDLSRVRATPLVTDTE